MQNTSTSYNQELKEYLWVKPERSEHEKILWNKVEKYTKLFKYIPWVKCICICNSLAMNAANESSDIDLFVITTSQRLWTARIMMTLSMALIWERKNHKNHAGKFCLSFFVSEQHLDLWTLAIKNDIYLQYWIQTLIPIINRNATFEKFKTENSYWINNVDTIHNSKPQSTQTSHDLWNDTSKLWDFVEYILKTIFLPRTKKRFSKLWKPFGVIITDTMLKFHNEDQRIIIRDQILWD
jgi:predicted nucleotidyltransferase